MRDFRVDYSQKTVDYSQIILNSSASLLCSYNAQHNIRRPNSDLLETLLETSVHCTLLPLVPPTSVTHGRTRVIWIKY